jgi:hypothetical protein
MATIMILYIQHDYQIEPVQFCSLGLTKFILNHLMIIYVQISRLGLIKFQFKATEQFLNFKA